MQKSFIDGLKHQQEEDKKTVEEKNQSTKIFCRPECNSNLDHLLQDLFLAMKEFCILKPTGSSYFSSVKEMFDKISNIIAGKLDFEKGVQYNADFRLILMDVVREVIQETIPLELRTSLDKKLGDQRKNLLNGSLDSKSIAKELVDNYFVSKKFEI